jgi:two-component system CheB/CheR fusion protein
VRVSQGQVPLEPTDIAIGDVIEQALQTVKPLLDSRRQRSHVNLPATPIRLRADAALLVQVFSSLLDNASRFSPEQGDVFITATEAGGRLEVRVRDSGAGIPSELLPALFDFFPARNQTENREGAGLGLSLATARMLLEAHRGRITVASEGHGKGTEFVVDLPLAEAQDGRMQVGTEARPGPAIKNSASAFKDTHRRVLIADDSEPVRTSLSSLLSELGHEVKCATDGEQALEVARNWRPEFVLLDINMPKLGGVEVARRLRPEFSSEVMKLVMMSGADMDQGMVAGAKRVGFDFVIDKIDALEPLRNILGQDAPAGLRSVREG